VEPIQENNDVSKGKPISASLAFGRRHLHGMFVGGHSVEFYLDDLTYTADRASDSRRTFVPQTTVEIPYPHEQRGRRY
jgi:hypothetical protein